MIGLSQKDITIKSLSDELGISKQAITKRIKKLGFYDELQTVGGRLVLTDNQRKQVIEAFSAFEVGENQQPPTDNQPTTDNQKENNEREYRTVGDSTASAEKETDNQKKEESTTDNQQIIIESLLMQLAEKDKQINELHQRLSEVHTLLNQQQHLMAVEQQKALPAVEEKKKGILSYLMFWKKE